MTGEPEHPAATANRRKRPRISLRLPVRVRGRELDGSVFEELASCVDASEGGVSIWLQHPVRRGQLLHLSLPLPARFRQYDLTDHSYRVYGLVRNVAQGGDHGARVGFMFFGRMPPHGAEALPAELFVMPGELASPEPRGSDGVPLTIRLAAEDAPGAVAQEEAAVAERVAAWEALVTIRSLPVTTGATVLVKSADGSFESRADVRRVLIGADGDARIEIVFLDSSVPKHLQVAAEEGH